MDKKESVTNESSSPVIRLTEKTQVIYTNQMVILSASPEEVEIGIGVRTLEGHLEVTHRMFTSTGHFARIVSLFNSLSEDIKNKMGDK